MRNTRLPRFLFDGRNALNAAHMTELGFDYRGVGRGTRDLVGAYYLRNGK